MATLELAMDGYIVNKHSLIQTYYNSINTTYVAMYPVTEMLGALNTSNL